MTLKAAWPECVITTNAAENTSILLLESIALAHDVDGDGCNTSLRLIIREINTNKMIQDERVSDSDLIKYLTNLLMTSKECNSMTDNTLYLEHQL